MTRLRIRPSSLAGLAWARPGAAERARRNEAWARLKAEMDSAARKLTRDIVKRRARALLGDPGQLEMIALDLSQLPPAAMIARIKEVRRATRSLRARPDPLVGRVDAHNLNAAELAARWLRRAERRERLRREAA
ncbi:hypothetical protein SAMN05444161_1698 [Rhizobiales bacterium GAS191]|nr:hypothetical protein SAMN05444161_1698 [Rhizobiales bacterium GAS191]